MPEIRIEQRGAVRVLTIANEAKRNAFSGDMVYELLDALDAAEAARDVRAIVITGAGDLAFSSGHDLTEMLADRAHASDARANHAFLRPPELSKPVIAAVNGHCHAAGFILALSCDLRVASENAVFGAPGIRIGLLPIGGQLARLPRLLPQARAVEMLLTGDPLSAQEALALGFVSRVVPRGQALDAALALAQRIAGNSPAVARAIKRGVEHGLRSGVAAAESYEWTVGRLLQGGPDAEEGIRAFLEKRPPVFADPD